MKNLLKRTINILKTDIREKAVMTAKQETDIISRDQTIDLLRTDIANRHQTILDLQAELLEMDDLMNSKNSHIDELE